MTAKPDLIPDCDVHGTPLTKTEYPGAEMGQQEDVIEVWRCTRAGCRRLFYGDSGYGSLGGAAGAEEVKPQCPKHGAFLVVQAVHQTYVCPVDGCRETRPWPTPTQGMGL